jgi:hypothetical protein
MLTIYGSADHAHQSLCGHGNYSTNSMDVREKLKAGRWMFWQTRKDLLPLLDNSEVLDAEDGRTHYEKFTIAGTKHNIENLNGFLKEELGFIKMIFGKDHPDFSTIDEANLVLFTPIPKEVLVERQRTLAEKETQEGTENNIPVS